LQAILDICLEDDCSVRDLQPDGSYVRRRPASGKGRSAFSRLVGEAAAQSLPRQDRAASQVPKFLPRRKGGRPRG
jgi:hypothetical protein